MERFPVTMTTLFDAARAFPSVFDALGLPRPLLRVLERSDITRPFPIQAATIPDALAGRDVLGRGRTGSGKTLALGLFTKTAFGGSPYQTQIFALERGVDVLVATPGRLADLIERGVCALDAVEVAVLDEADQMADLGFLPDVTALLAQTPAGGQRLL